MKTLVTGGSGYLGTHLTRLLNADTASRRNGFDMGDPDTLSRIEDYDVVVHLAAMVDKDPSRDREIFAANVTGTINVLERVKENAVLIFASTREVYGRFADNFQVVPESCPTLYAGQSPLEWSKLVAERYVEYYAAKRHFRSCILRLGTVYAPPTPETVPNFVGYYAEMINLGERFALPGSGTAVRDLLHIDDLAEACRAFVDSVIRHGLYNVGGGAANASDLNGLIARMESVSGLQAVLDREAGLPEPVPHRYISDLTLISQELEWQPKVELDAGLRTLFSPQPY